MKLMEKLSIRFLKCFDPYPFLLGPIMDSKCLLSFLADTTLTGKKKTPTFHIIKTEVPDLQIPLIDKKIVMLARVAKDEIITTVTKALVSYPLL